MHCMFSVLTLSWLALAVSPAAPPAETKLLTPAKAAIVERAGVTLSYDRGGTWLPVVSVEYPPPPRDPYHGIPLGSKRHAPLIVIEGGMVDPNATSASIPRPGQFFKTIMIGLRNRNIILSNATVSAVTPLGMHSTTKVSWSGTPGPQGHHTTSGGNEYLKVSYTFEKIEYTDTAGKALYSDSWHH